MRCHAGSELLLFFTERFYFGREKILCYGSLKGLCLQLFVHLSTNIHTVDRSWQKIRTVAGLKLLLKRKKINFMWLGENQTALKRFYLKHLDYLLSFLFCFYNLREFFSHLALASYWL
jgi:hypothetical protein